MPRTYRAQQSGAFGTNAYPDTRPQVDIAGAIGAVTQAVATTREALILREQMRKSAERQARMDQFTIDRAMREDARADRQEGREDRRETREQDRADREAAAALEDQRFKGAERRAKGYVPGGVRAVPRVGSGVSPMPSIQLLYQAPRIDPTQSVEYQTEQRERGRKREAYGRSGRIPEPILDAAVEDDAIARSYLGNPRARAGSRDADQEEEEDIARAFTAVNAQVDDARGRVQLAREKVPKRPEMIESGPPIRPSPKVLKRRPSAEQEFIADSIANVRYEADSARAAQAAKPEIARLDSLLTVQEALAAQMQGKEPPRKVQGGSSSAPAPPKPAAASGATRASMLEKARKAYEASIAKPGADSAALRARYQRIVSGINAKYPR